MSDTQRRDTGDEQSSSDGISPTRRTFLQATGMAALATGAGVQSGGATAPAEGPGGPGRISNLAAYLEDPTTVAENAEPTHVTTAVPYESVRAAREADEPFTELESRFAESKYVRLLNGEWQFAFHGRPADVPDSYDDLGADDWGSIDVPGVWQTQGYDKRIYANNSITWDHYDPPQDGDLVPGDDGTVDVPGVGDDGYDPVGTYRRTFSVPEEWDGRRTFLHFEGVKQAFFVWIDGEYVGFRTGSMTPGEFDVSEHVAAGGDHQVTVQVYRWSDSEALETIDMFRYAGIFRSVYLFATPTVHLRDFYARADLDDDYEDGHLRIDAEIANYGEAPQGEYEVRAHLYENDRTRPGRGPPKGKGKKKAKKKGDGTKKRHEKTERGPKEGRGPGDNPPRGRKVTTIEATATVDEHGAVVTLEADVDDPAKWSAEHPNLYQLALELAPAGGEPTEAMLEKVGFRTYETTRGRQGAEVLVNGEPVDVQGVNRHETDPDFGRTVPVERVREDLETMQRFNVNAIRTSHYPNDPSFYRLADEYGVYVQDEVGVETHWWEGLLADTEVYHDQAVEQFRRMVLRDRNHASIFSWSTGNEAGTGAEHLNMAALAMDSDEHLPSDTSGVSGVSTVESFDGDVEGFAPDRIMYHQPNGGGWNVEYSDMLGPRYPDVGTLLSVADGSYIGDGLRPVVMGEYNHAMGNSLGLVHEMWSEHIKPPARAAADRSEAGNEGVLVGSPDVVPGPDAGPGGDTDGAVVLGEGDAIEVRRDPSVEVDVGFAVGATISDVDADADAPLVVDDGRFALELSDGEIEFSVGGDAATAASLPAGATDDWTTVAGVADAGELRVYVDGERVAAATHSVSELPAGDGPVRIGGDGADLTVDGVGIYDRAVGAAEASDADGTLTDGAVAAYDFADLLRDKCLAGGFVWDWVNQDLNDVTEDGEAFQFYHSDGPDGAFCLNGLVWSDRDAQPELTQLKHSHQPVGVADADVAAGEIYVSNRFNFTDFDALDASWELTADDVTVETGELHLDLKPGETRRVDVPVEVPSDPEPGVEYRLTLSFTLPEATVYAEAGHEVAFEQLEVPVDAPEPEPESLEAMAPLSVAESESDVVVSGDGFEYTLAKDAGTFSSLRYGGTELVDDGPAFNAWRAPIMNETVGWGGEEASNWYEAGLDDLTQTVRSVSTDRPDDSLATIEVDAFVEGASPGTLLSTPDASGAGNDGTVYGDPDLVAGQSDQAIAFDGADDYVDAGGASSLDFTSTGFTVQATFRGLDTGGHSPFVAKGDHQYALKINGDQFSFFIYDPNEEDELPWKSARGDIPSDIDPDAWHTLTGVCAESELRLFLDGELIGTRSLDIAEINDSEAPVQVAHNAEKTGRYAETTIDGVRIYDRALSAEEVASGFDSPPESAVLWYDFEEVSAVSSATVTPDATSFGNDATLQNDPAVVEGVSGRALALDGQSHLAFERSESLDITEGGLTLECWVRPGEPQDGAGAQPYVAKGPQYLLKRREAGRGGALELAFNADGWQWVETDVPADWAGSWHHIAGVWDAEAGELRLYVDGERQAAKSYDGTLEHWDSTVTVGRDGGAYVADGTLIDEVRIYDRGLGDDEVAALDAAPLDGAVAWLNLDSYETVERRGPGFDTRYRYRVFGSGDVAVDVDAEPNDRLVSTIDDYLPKIGLQLEARDRFDEFEWYGRGELETYPDRKWGVPIGRYSGSVDDQYVPYLPPTDNGNKAQTRWAALSDGDVSLLGMPGDEDANVSLEQWANLDAAEHRYELEDRGTVGFNLDHRVTGVGGTPTQPIDRYQVRPEPTAFSVVLRPFDPDAADPMDLANRRLPDAE